MRTNQLDHLAIPSHERMPHRMHVSDRSVRERNTKIHLEVCFLSNGLLRHFDDPLPILGENAIIERLVCSDVLVRIEPKKTVHFGRPIHELLTARVPSPAAGTTQALGFGQVSLAAPQHPFCLPYARNVHHRADKFDVSRFISLSSSDGMDI